MKKNLTMIPMETLLSKSLCAFNSMDRDLPIPFPKVSLFQKYLHERRLRKLLEKTTGIIPDFSGKSWKEVSDDEKNGLKENFKGLAQVLDQDKLLYDSPFLMDFMRNGFLESTEDFFKNAQTFDPSFEMVDLFQAVRNVWIMNCLQLIFQAPVKLTPSIFSYSMLYPYTDNYLDSLEVSSSDKKKFNRMISDTISGRTIESLTPYESKVHQLLKNIEKEFPRHHYPMVYEALWYIQDAQSESLHQGSRLSQSLEEVLSVSFYKGGSSVLADACLILGDLDYEQISFAFGYGTFLQLLDDLQDRSEDARNHHQTLFSRKPLSDPLDDEILAIFHYIDLVLCSLKNNSETVLQMKGVIRNCMRMMIESVIGKNPTYVTRSFYRQLEASSFVRLSFYREMDDLVTKSMKNHEHQFL